MNETAKKKITITPSPEELKAFLEELNNLLVKYNFLMSPVLKMTAQGIKPELSVVKTVEVTDTPSVAPEVKPPLPVEKSVDEKAIN